MHEPILVGDIGSTKSTWWYGTTEPIQLKLPGYNPVTHTDISREVLFKSLRDQTGASSFSSIWYYGAGVIDQQISHAIFQDLKAIFPTSTIQVHSDLVGACFAACGENPGTSAILGTGSHAATWDGSKIVRQATALGYILGDEGGGCDIGKALIQAYFYNEMPDHIRPLMDEKIPKGRSGFFADFYSSNAPNQFLADFARVAVKFQEDFWIKTLIASRFDLFIKKHVLPLAPDGQIQVVGSIGSIFASLINQELVNNQLTAGNFIQDPAQRLFERHHEHGKK